MWLQVSVADMVARYAGKRTIDVLRLDCGGCEWGAFRRLAATHPALLRRVRLLLIRVHVRSSRLQLRAAADFTRFAEHVFGAHGFRVYRHQPLLGMRRERGKVLASMIEAGLDPSPCCYELQLTRGDALLAPTTDAYGKSK